VTIVSPLASFGNTPVILSVVPAGRRISASEGMAESLPMSIPRLVRIYNGKPVCVSMLYKRNTCASEICFERTWKTVRSPLEPRNISFESAAMFAVVLEKAHHVSYRRQRRRTRRQRTHGAIVSNFTLGHAKLHRMCYRNTGSKRNGVPTRPRRSCLGRRSQGPS
jgi:hypothetical protein